MTEEKYDGLTVKKDGRYTSTTFNIDGALDQSNPRNLFLNGQLFVEMYCDSIIGTYFTKGPNPNLQYLIII